MSKQESLTVLGRRSHWLLASGCVMCLALAGSGGLAGTAGPAGGSPATAPVAPFGTYDVQTANDVLVTDRLLLQFYNANAQKSYLVGTQPVTPAPGSGTPAVNPGGTTSPVFTGPVLTANLSGSAESPAVNSSATGTASFTLSQDQTAVLYNIQVSGLSGPAISVRVRRGLPGQPGGIILYTLNPMVNGVSSGQFNIRPGDVEILLNNEFYVEITTDLYPQGEVRGFLGLPSGGSNPPSGTGTPTTGTTPSTPSSSSNPLLSMVNEIRANHSAHVAMLEQMLGTSAQPAPTFQNLDAPTLPQFLIMATTLEDLAVGVDQNAVLTPAPSPSPTTPIASPGTTQTVFGTEVAILADNGRHAGAFRAFRKLAGTADGGDPNISITENGTPFNVARTRAQLTAFLQPYLPATTPGTTGTP